MKKIFIILLILDILFNSCENVQHDKAIEEANATITDLRDSLVILQDSITLLRNTRFTLNEELKIYKLNPQKIAYNIDQLFKEGKIDELIKISRLLHKSHPESEETIKVQNLINRYNSAQEEKVQAEREAKRSALKNLKRNYDNVQNITWYYNKRFTHYNNTNHTSIYIGQHGLDGNVWLRLKMSYAGDDWIFFDKAYLSYDGNTLEIPFDKYEDRESDNSGGRVWEWIDVNVTPDILIFLSGLVNGNEVKMRLSGKYSHTRTIPSSEVSAIKEVLLGYELLQDPNNR